MDRRRQVTVVDLEHDGLAAVEERRKKAEAAVDKKLGEIQCRVEVEEPVTSPQRTEQKVSESKLTLRQADAREGGFSSVISAAAPPAEKQHQLDVVASDQPVRKSASPENHDESVGVGETSERKGTPLNGRGQGAVQTDTPRFEADGVCDVPHPPSRIAASNEPTDRGACEVSDMKASKKNAQQPTKGRVVKLEYTASPPADTEVTGNFLFDELNRFMDEWLVPDEISSRAKDTARIAAAGDARDRLSRDTQIVQTLSSQDLRQITTVDTACDWKSCLPELCGSANTRSTTVCPLCNRNVTGIDEFRGPSLSRKWTRWIFRQCEEPLDMEAEFLVTPRARLLSPRGREACNYQRVSSPYQTHILGVTH